jgi:phosphonatase-like hydrolase
MLPRVDLFLLDLAGTTVVDDDHVLRSLLQTAQAFDLAVEPAELQSRMGWHKAKVFASLLEARGLDAAPAEAMAQRFAVEFAALVLREPLRKTPGASATLAQLTGGSVQIGFTTGFTRKTANVVLEAMGWQQSLSVASDEVAHGRPAPDLIQRAMQICGIDDPKRVGVVGDTPADLGAGAAAGVGMIVGVGCGTHTLAQLAHHPHTHLLDDLRGLPKLVFAHE